MDEIPVIVILDDDPSDAYLLRRALGRQIHNGMYVTAETREQYLEALQSPRIDVIVSDSSILGLGAMDAFVLGKASHQNAAFFIFSGAIKDELATLAHEEGVAASIEKQHMEFLIPLIVDAIKSR